MALSVRCPNGHPLTFKNDAAGKRVRCSKCKIVFVVEPDEDEDPPAKKSKSTAPAGKKRKPADDLPPKKKKRVVIDDDDDDGDKSLSPDDRRKQRQRDKKERLKKVYVGLLIHIVKMWVIVVLVLFGFLTLIFSNTVEHAKLGDEPLSREAVDIFKMVIEVCRIVLLIGLVAAPALGVAGSAFCCIIPKKSDSRGNVVIALVFDVIALIGSILIPLAVFNVLELDPVKNERLRSLLESGSGFFNLAAVFLFILFLRQLGYYLQRSTLASEGLNLVSWLMIMTLTGPLALGALTMLAPMIIGAVGGVLNLAIMFLLTLIWFACFYYLFFQPVLRLINGLRDRIAELTGMKKDLDEDEDEEGEEDED